MDGDQKAKMLIIGLMVALMAVFVGTFIHNVFFMKCGKEVHEGSVIIEFKPDVTKEQAAQMVAGHNATLGNITVQAWDTYGYKYVESSDSWIKAQRAKVSVPVGREGEYISTFKKDGLVNDAFQDIEYASC